MTLQNANLKKRVMTMVVTGVMASGAVVSAPLAQAASTNTPSQQIVDAYDKLSGADLARYDQQIKSVPKGDSSIELLPSSVGAGWCIDWGLGNPWDSGNYEVRKLTGASGRVGTGNSISSDVNIAAINVVKELQKDYKAYANGDSSKKGAIETKIGILRALLSNQLGYLNQAREDVVNGKVSTSMFEQLTGFRIDRHDAPKGEPNYYLIKTARHDQIAKTVKSGEYVTVLLPMDYDFNIVPRKSFQRLIPPVQPGLDQNPPKDTPTIVTTATSTPEAVTTTITRPQEATVTTTLPNTTITETVTNPATTVTERSTLPTAYTTVSTREVPGKVVTSTVTPEPHEVVTTVTERNTPKVVTTTVNPEPHETVVTEPGTPVVTTETVSDTPVVTTKPGETVTTTRTTQPVTTITSTNPAVTETVTSTVTPEPTEVTTTVTDVEKYFVEKYYERVKEVSEYYYFAGFTRDEKSKVIELPEKIGNKWTFEIIKGSDIVIVERSEDGKLVITPREDFEGEGEVEILITDDQGNQHIYRVKVTDTVAVNDSVQVNVNNFFYTLNAGSEDRVTTIPWKKGEKIDWGLGYDKDGNLIQPKHGEVKILKDENKGTVTVEANEGYRGNVIVKITEENGNVRENIVTVENKTSRFDVTREILNTSTAKIENRGGDYKIISGGDKVTIEKQDDVWVVTPKDGATGDVEVLFTDENGFEYKYTLKLVEDLNAGPEIFTRELEYKSEQPDTLEIKYVDGYTAEIVAGEDKAKIEKSGDKWVVTPTDPNGGEVTVHIKDENGRLAAVWIVNIAPQEQDEVENVNREREVTDRSNVQISRGNADYNWLVVEEGEEFLAKGSKTDKDGDFELKFKPVPEGETRTVKVVEYVKGMKDQLDENGDPLLDENGNKLPQVEADLPIKTYTYTVKPSPVREMDYSITSDNELKLYGTHFRIAKGADLLAEQPEKDASEIKVTPKRDAKGTLVIENVSEDGYVFERYTFEITPGRSADIEPEKATMGWESKATISSAEGETFKVLEGEDLVDVKRDGDNLIVTGKGKAGTALIQVSDNRGVYGKYEITLNEPKRNGLHTYKVSTTGAFEATLVNEQNRFQVVQGADAFQAPEESNGKFLLRPKADKVGETGVVVEYNKDGQEINRYKLEIVEGKSTGVRQQRDFLIEGEPKELKPLADGNKLVVTTGADLVDAKDANGTLKLTAKKGSANKAVRVDERNADGDLVRVVQFGIYPEGTRTSEGAVISDNNDLPIVIDGSVKNNSPVNVKFPDNVSDIVFTKGREYFEDGDKGVKITDEGVVLTPRKDLKPGSYEAAYLLVGPEGQSYGERTIEINVDVKSTETEQQGSSAELDGKCIAGIVGLSAPLLLAIPLGILSQVQIPGLEGVSAQINGAIQQANDQIQRGLGIYDEDRAQRAAGFQAAFNIQNPEMIGMAAGALGAITLGLLAVDGVMRACGAEEYTSSYMVGKATGNETLMNGSSGKTSEGTEDKAEAESSKAEEK
ncbi:hypothetical protein [Corynebacterium fournieri]|uniref:hypothetical protein n=1 Tax=Corynebacterium fournieri TaxID=1852390 RepID=UPI000A2F2FB3|nr:hypothetical protein [Corynebacterium fournieri]WJY96472.1 hypothetical protein CFOUR_00100 [Corynebacterium fournieri]